MFAVIPAVFIIAIIVIAIVFITRSRRSAHTDTGTEGIAITRRVWLYLITLISLGIFAAGVGQLLTLLFDVTIGSLLTQVGRENFNQEQLSMGLAMTVIGGPLWFFFWRAIQRRVKGNEEEIGSAIRKFFLNFISLETAIMGITTVSNLFRWLIAGVPLEEFSSNDLAIVIVAALIWFYHWRVSESEGHPSAAARTLRRWYAYILAGFGLVWLAVGLVQLINTAVISLPVWGNTLVSEQFWNSDAQMSVAMILFGGMSWYFHWFRMVRGDYDSTLRQVYFYIFAIPGGTVTALVALTLLLFRLFIWVFNGVPVSESPHLQFLGWAIPTILVGVAIWGYHRRLAQEETEKIQEKRQSAQRIYLYLMSFIGLGTLVAGLSLLFGIFVDLIINAASTPLTATGGWWRNQLALCLALTIAGLPVWFYYWRNVLKRAETGGIAESRALSRRIYLYVIIGVSIILLAADLVNIIYQVMSGALQGDFNIDVLRNSKWSLQTLIIAVPLLWYHWQILRADQRYGAELAVVRRSITLLADDRSGDLASRLESKLGYKIHLLYQSGQIGEKLPTLPDEEIGNLVSEIQASSSNRIMLVVHGGKVIVLPYQDK
jgi:hypothetical protein